MVSVTRVGPGNVQRAQKCPKRVGQLANSRDIQVLQMTPKPRLSEFVFQFGLGGSEIPVSPRPVDHSSLALNVIRQIDDEWQARVCTTSRGFAEMRWLKHALSRICLWRASVGNRNGCTT